MSKYYSEICEYLGNEVEEYDYKLETRDKTLPSMPTEAEMTAIATRRYWIEKGESMVKNPYTDLDLQWPLPRCMHVLLKTIGEIRSDWKGLVVKNEAQKRRKVLEQEEF